MKKIIQKAIGAFYWIVKWISVNKEEIIVIIERQDFVTHFKLDKKLNRRFFVKFGMNRTIREAEFVSFMESALGGDGAIEFFAESARESLAVFEATSVKPNKESSVNTQTFYITYFDGEEIVVKSEYNGKAFTISEIESWKNYTNENVIKGDRYSQKNYSDWVKKYFKI